MCVCVCVYGIFHLILLFHHVHSKHLYHCFMQLLNRDNCSLITFSFKAIYVAIDFFLFYDNIFSCFLSSAFSDFFPFCTWDIFLAILGYFFWRKLKEIKGKVMMKTTWKTFLKWGWEAIKWAGLMHDSSCCLGMWTFLLSHVHFGHLHFWTTGMQNDLIDCTITLCPEGTDSYQKVIRLLFYAHFHDVYTFFYLPWVQPASFSTFSNPNKSPFSSLPQNLASELSEPVSPEIRFLNPWNKVLYSLAVPEFGWSNVFSGVAITS